MGNSINFRVPGSLHNQDLSQDRSTYWLHIYWRASEKEDEHDCDGSHADLLDRSTGARLFLALLC